MVALAAAEHGVWQEACEEPVALNESGTEFDAVFRYCGSSSNKFRIVCWYDSSQTIVFTVMTAVNSRCQRLCWACRITCGKFCSTGSWRIMKRLLLKDLCRDAFFCRGFARVPYIIHESVNSKQNGHSESVYHKHNPWQTLAMKSKTRGRPPFQIEERVEDGDIWVHQYMKVMERGTNHDNVGQRC